MDTTKSKVLFPITPLVFRKTLSVPEDFSLKSQDYVEESIVQCFREYFVEKKQDFFKKWFKPDVNLLYQPFPIDSNLFNEETQCTITLLSQFLGLETDKYITDPLISFLFVLSTFPIGSDESIQVVHVSCLKIDDFLAENIHS